MKRLDMENGSRVVFTGSSDTESLRSVQSSGLHLDPADFPLPGHPAWVLSLFEGYPTWITLPGPPHAKKRPRVVRGGQAYKPDAAQERAIAWGVRSQWRGEPIVDPVAVYAAFWLPDLRTKDIDNLIKALLDGCNAAGIWGDDRQVEVIVATRGVDRENPRTELAVGAARKMR